MWSEGDQVHLWIWEEVQIRAFPGCQTVFGKTGSDHLWQSCRRVEKDYDWKLAIWFSIREVTSIGTIFGGMVDKSMWVIHSREMWRLIVEPVIKNDILHFEGIYCEEEQRHGLTAGKSTVRFLVVYFLRTGDVHHVKSRVEMKKCGKIQKSLEYAFSKIWWPLWMWKTMK